MQLNAGTLTVVFTVLTSAFAEVAKKVLAGAQAIEPVVPLTRVNSGDLPAPESLMRASQEPPQAQEAILLRAVAEGQQTPPEQLVRPAAGQE